MREGKKQPIKRLDLISVNKDYFCGGCLDALVKLRTEVESLNLYWICICTTEGCCKNFKEVKVLINKYKEIYYPSKGMYKDRSNTSGR